METLDPKPPDLEADPGSEAPLVPMLDVDVASVSVVDGMWQDQPDNVAAFVEARLGALAHGRGNLYLCLDVSGEVEGRSDIERTLIEVLRDTYAESRGSISFGLSEALRAANAYLFESNRQVARELRRMSGVSAVVLRGNDLYIAQAGPAVVFVEAGGTLARYPAESDWFVEDAPLISPQGTASPPLGMRREFACDLAHASVLAGDVFVLATRSLTTLASTRELAIAFTERSSEEIAGHLEEMGQDADVTALVAELIDPHSQIVVDQEEELEPHIESVPIPLTSLVPLDESEPALVEDEVPAQPEPAQGAILAEEGDWELDWEQAEVQAAPEQEPPVMPPVPQPVYASAAMALPLRTAPAFTPSPPPYDAELEQRRAERAERRSVLVSRGLGALVAALATLAGAVAALFAKTLGALDWDAIGKRTNQLLNMGVSAMISLSLLIVRLILPGSKAASTKILPRRTTSEPLWLKAFAFLLPALFGGLALWSIGKAVYDKNLRYDALVAQANNQVKQAALNPDKTVARQELKDALATVRQALAIHQDAPDAQQVLYQIQDQSNELDGIAVLRFLPMLAQLNGASLRQVAAGDQDLFLLDGRGRIYQFIVNDASGVSKPVTGDGTILKQGDKVGEQSVTNLQLVALTSRAGDKAALVAVSDDSLLLYDLEASTWLASPVKDASQWGNLRAISTFGGNVYLLDTQNNQIYRYTPTANGYSAQGAPYFARTAQPVLQDAVDMAIDGDVWILNHNGTVQRYRQGAPVPFDLGDLPTPLKQPVAIFTRPEVDSLYIADAGNQRIVEFDKNGTFVREFKPAAEKGDVFKTLQDFTVNETKRKLYLVNTNAAFMANVPK